MHRFISIALGAALLSLPALSQTGEHGDGHTLYHHDAYSRWAIPGGAPGSCCRAKRQMPWGGVTGDCYPTEARLIDGKRWQAKRDNGEWVDIPESRIIRERNPDPTGRAAHLCYSDYQNVVLCFVPPFGAL